MQLQDPKAHTDTLSLIAEFCQAGTFSQKKEIKKVFFFSKNNQGPSTLPI
jgi:hypothetical protein